MKTILVILVSIVAIIVILFYYKQYENLEIEIPDQVVITVLDALDFDDYVIDIDCDAISAGSIPIPSGGFYNIISKRIVEDLGIIEYQSLYLDSNLVCDFGMDYLDYAELITSIFSEFDLIVHEDDESADNLYTFEKILKFVEERLDKQNLH